MAEARQGTGVGHFRNANEGSAEAESVGDESYKNGESGGGERGFADGGCGGIGACEPNSSRQAQEGNRRERRDFARGGHGEFRKQIGDGEAAGDQRQKDDGEQEASGVRDSAEESGREKSHQEPGRGDNGEEAEGACGEGGNA